MRVLFVFAWLCLLASCGESPPVEEWSVDLRDAAGNHVPFFDSVFVVHVTSDAVKLKAPYRVERVGTTADLHLLKLLTGHYELWVPGCKPVRIDQEPTKPIVLEVGYPIDVSLPDDATIKEGESVQVRALWRGPGDHPQAVLRTIFYSSAPAPGSRSSLWIGFVRGILLDNNHRKARMYVPWPGLYRVTWATGEIRIEERPGWFSGSGGGSRSPQDGLPVDVSDTKETPQITLPLR